MEMTTEAKFRTGSEGEAICPHRDLSVCPTCASHPFIVEVVGAHYFIPDSDERAELLEVLGA